MQKVLWGGGIKSVCQVAVAAFLFGPTGLHIKKMTAALLLLS